MVKKQIVALICLFILLYTAVGQQIYPDHYEKNDIPFLKDLQGNNFLYKARYFTNVNINPPTIRNIQLGVTYEPEFLAGTAYSTTNPMLNAAIINMRDTGSNLSQMREIFSYTFSEFTIPIPFPIEYVFNKLYTFTYSIPIYSISNEVNLEIAENGGGTTRICQNNPYLVNSMRYFILTITYRDDTGNNIFFQCFNEAPTLVSVGGGALSIIFSGVSLVNNLSISNYFITLSIQGTNPSFTTNGKPSCTSNQECLEGYRCSGARCEKCDSNCRYCNTNPSVCSDCGRNTIGGNCQLDYVDLSQYSDVVDTVPPPRTNRVTLGVWAFVSNHNLMAITGNIFHIAIEDFFVLSFSVQNVGTQAVPGNMAVYCTIYDKLYPRVKETKALNDFNTMITSTDMTGLSSMSTVNESEGRWFHSQCAMSYDHGTYYLSTLINNKSRPTEKPIPKIKFYKGAMTNDEYFRIIYRNGESTKLSILNIQSMNTKIYLRNLIIFQEFIPSDVHYMYHHLFNSIGINDFPEVIYMLPFANFDGIQLDVKKSPSYVTEKIPLSNAITLNQLPPLNFKALPLLATNMKYQTIDLASTQNIVSNSAFNLLLFDDDAPMSCSNDAWVSNAIDPTTRHRICSTNCDADHITYPGISPSKGYCNYQCTISMQCKSSNMNDIQNTNICNGSFQLYYFCVDEKKNRNLYFSSLFRHANVVLDFTAFNFNSYFIEFWFFPDFTISQLPTVRAPQAIYNNRNYLFYSNAVQFYYDSININYYFFSEREIGPINNRLSPYEWNKVILNVVFNGVNYELEVLINNDYANPINLGTGINKRLTTISFCHMDQNSCGGNDIFWGSAFYKNLKIWDGELSQPQATIQYDDFYPSETSRLGAIARFLPLSHNYFANNELVDPVDGLPKSTDPSIAWNPWRLRIWNYSSRFDLIDAEGGKFYINAVSSTLLISKTQCPMNCHRCWSGIACYSCSTGFFLNNLVCTQKNTYYFKSPNRAGDTPEITIGSYDETTITLWIKPIGFNSATSEFLEFGNEIYLEYEKDINNVNNGLSLFIRTPKTRLAQVPNFRDFFGQWIFMSLAYYNDKHSAFFPPMMKFEIGTNSYEIDMPQINAKRFTLAPLRISNNYYGLIYSIKVYDKFIVGAYGFEKNPDRPTDTVHPNPVGTYLVGSNSINNCYGSELASQNSFDCQADADARLSFTCSGYQYVNSGLGCNACPTTGGSPDCVNFCYNNNGRSCTCMTQNNNSQMFFRNNNAIYCKKFDYINWAKAQNQVIDVQTAKSTQRFTMHFWVYAYSYVDGAFKGITFEWKYHNTILIRLKGMTTQYEFICEAETSTVKQQIKVDIAINQWNFLSCAVDFANSQKIYVNTNNENPQSDSADLVNTNPHPRLIADLRTQLTIKDDTNTISPTFNEWGVLFYSQIRLWSEAYFTAEFLSRINIQTHSLFPYLLHAWEPLFAMNQLVSEINGNVPGFTVVNTGTIGPNIVDENDYSKLFLCTEDGQYYDVTTQSCLQFVDLSRMNDIGFTQVPVSHTGSYSMAFWFFTEDFNTLTEGVHVQWTNHMQISIQKKSLLDAICFPQGYYADKVSNTNLALKESTVLNTKDEVLQDGTSGVWHWVICSMSNFNQVFELNGESKDIIAETLFDTTLSSHPYRYWMTEDREVSVLNLVNIQNTMKIYFRSIQLFNDFIPYHYNIKYMDLSRLLHRQFPSLLFVVNFVNYEAGTNLLTYNTFEPLRKSTYTVRLVQGTPGTLALSANFIFLPLCNFVEFLGNHYNPNTNSCVPNQRCDLNAIKAIYCSEDNVPLCCQPNNYINIDPNNNLITCESKCPNTTTTRGPGTPPLQAICNSKCPAGISNCPNSGTGDLGNFHGSYKCNNGFYRINYQCLVETASENSGFYYSRCYKPPNIYHQISNGAKLKMAKGYLLEFWFKIDFSLNTCSRDFDLDYYFYSTPHSIFVNTKTNVWSYQVINTVNTGLLSGIHGYEWNKVVFKTTLGTTGQSVQVFVNHKFNNADVNIRSIPASTSMQLQFISFCSNQRNGLCTAGGTAPINWGSAYYRNIRVWDLMSSSTEVLEGYNNKVFTNTIKSLILFYPLTIQYMDVNVLQEVISNESIVYKKIFGRRDFYSEDEYLFYNYEVNFDWGVNNPNKLINSIKSDKTIDSGPCVPECIRCYSYSIFACYECANNYILINQECRLFTHYYLKTPANSSGTTTSPIALVTAGATLDLTTSVSFTLSFYMKFEGVIKESTSGAPEILTLNSNTYLAYDVSTTYLLFYQNNRVAFEDQNFSKYFGKWIPIVIANYVANTFNSKYPNMLTLSVNRIDIPFKTGYTIPTSGIPATSLILGADIVALFANLRAYDRFIQGNYGTMTSTLRDDNLILSMAFSSNSDNGCLTPAQTTGGNVNGIQCVMDYNEFLFRDNKCADDKHYLDPAITSSNPPCGSCNAACTTFCFSNTAQSCTCDLSEGYFWLRKNRSTQQTYCEFIPYLDFSILHPFTTATAPASQTQESTLELWMFIYSYNTNVNNFEQIDIEWSLHNKITLINIGNSLSVYCYPLYDINNPTRYTEKITLGFTFFQWNLIRCGTNLRFKDYFMNGATMKFATLDIPSRGTTTSFRISQPAAAKVSFGFVFLRDIKLWQQYNFNNVNSGFINLKSFSKYPGLLSYYKNEYKGKYEIQDLIRDALPHQLNRRNHFRIEPANTVNSFMGYNIIDPDNFSYYSKLTLCEEGFVYNSSTSTCIAPTLTHCEFAGDISDNCITCPPTEIYLHIDGTCVAECPPHYFGLDLINQCRPCDTTCYTCSGILATECTSCTTPLFFNPNANTCINPCESAGLTASLLRPHVCVDFEADAELVNVSEDTPIDINTFHHIEARVFGATATPTSYLWRFDQAETIRINGNDPNLVLNGSPFADPTKLGLLNTPIVNTFFQLGYKYVVVLDIIKTQTGHDVTVSVPFILTMNASPKNGKLTIVPPVGLYNTTTFIITCEDWTDDTTNTLEYQFYSIETGTNTRKTLLTWSAINEIFSNFTVVYYQQPTSTINVYCEIKDQYNAITTVNKLITIANSIHTPDYNLSIALGNYVFPAVVTDAVLLARSEYLKSLGLDTYKTLQPSLFQTQFDPSLDQTLITKKDPECTTDFCNSNGDCGIVDVFIGCNCDLGFVGRNCNIDKAGYNELQKAYNQLYDKIFAELKNSITYDQFKSLHNLYFSAALFYQDPTFFSNKLDTFLTLSMNLFQTSVLNITSEYLDLFEFYYSFELTRLVKARLHNKNTTGYPYRNVTLNANQVKEFEVSFNYIINKLSTFLYYIANQYKNVQKTIEYESQNLYIGLASVNPTFSDVNFFKKRTEAYRSYVKFMKCLNYIEIEKLTNPYYQAWMIFVEFQNFPYSYNDTLLRNNTSPLILMRFVDATTGKDILISGCNGDDSLEIFLPFTSYNYLDALNNQKWLYDPKNYKSPDDPIFSNPIYINETGFISNDTIEMRIEKYNRVHNFSCTYYDTELKRFVDTGIEYVNFTSDSNYIVFHTSHLTEFTTFFIPNNMTFKVRTRFFYLKQPQLFAYWPNYSGNFAFFTLCVFIGLYLILVFILTLYDMKYFQQESLLEFLKREIVRVHLPYMNDKETAIKKLVPSGFNPDFKIDDYDYDNNYNKVRNRNFEFENTDNTKPQMLSLNKFGDDNKDTNNTNMFNIDDDHTFKNQKKGAGGYYEKGNNTKGFDTKTKKNNIINEADMDTQTLTTKGAVDKKFLSEYVNNLPKNFEDKNLEYQNRLEAFANLNLSMGQFMGQNLRERHIFISPIINISLFNPRWKKMIMLVTQVSILMIMLAIQMTANENATLDNVGLLIVAAFVSVLTADCLMYLLAIFFNVSSKQRRRLYKLVTGGGQLVIIKEWEQMNKKNGIYTAIGVIINIIIWGVAFYFSISFVAVWSVQALSWMVSFAIAFFLDFVLLEVFVELVIALIYLKRKDVSCLRTVGEFLNRARNYRCLWP